MLDGNYVVYDIEVLPNVFTCVIENSDGEQTTYEISPRKNEIQPFMQTLSELRLNKTYMVGFNNLGYDYPVIHYMIGLYELGYTDFKQLVRLIHGKSKEIISSTNNPDARFKHMVWENNHIVQQIDLFKLHHFDNKAKHTSLKRLQFNMRLPNIEEFDLDFNKPIKRSQHIDELIRYNKHDVHSTHQFLKMSKSAVAFREKLTKEHGKSFFNMNDTKIGEDYFTTRLIKQVGESVLYDYSSGKKVKRTTPRKIVPLTDIIFDNIQFTSPQFKQLLEQMKRLKMFVINGKFYWNEHDDYVEQREKLDHWKKDLKKRKKSMDKSDYNAEKKNLDQQLSIYADHHISIELDGIVFELGKGGLHATLRNSVVKSDKQSVIIDLDVTSYYPSIGISYNLYPEHLTKAFCPIYGQLKFDRMQFNKKEYPVENKMLKLSLNGTYGKTNSKYSVFYDPKYTMATTINGQLMLLMLWDLLRNIKGCSIIQANTDGITIKTDRDKLGLVSKVCRAWQNHTKMQLEQAIYKRMWIRDGNNYIAEFANGSVKSKGDYLYKSLYHDKSMDGDGVEWHKNHSTPVVQKAVEAFLMKGTPIKEFLQNHADVYDFFLVTNLNRGSRLMWGDGSDGQPKKLVGENQELQRNTRYLITKDGGYLTKVMPPLKGGKNERCFSINAGYKTSIYNQVEHSETVFYDIDYEFYIEEVKKLVDVFNISEVG